MLSIPHLIVIFVVALVVFGPQKLPELARTLGKVMAEVRRATGDLRMTFEDQMRELERESREIEQRKRELALRAQAAAPAAPAETPLPSESAVPEVQSNTENPADGDVKPA